MNIFVDKNERIEINFVTGLSKDGKTIYCDVDEKMLKEVYDNLDVSTIESHWCKFRRPSYADVAMIQEGAMKFQNGSISFSPSTMSLKQVCCLLVDWSFKADGEKVPATADAFGALQPQVAALIASMLEERV